MKRYKLGDLVARIMHGGTPPTDNPALWAGDIPWITGADIVHQRVGDIRRHIKEKAVKATTTNVVSKGDLLLVTRTGVGKMAVAPFAVAISQDFTGLTFDVRVADTNYMYWLLQAKTNELLVFNQGTSINGIVRSDLLNLEVELPQKAEQTAIANILTAVDQASAQTEALIAKQRRIKAGLLHDLLTRGIDAQGNLRDPATHRFKASPVGLVPEEWEVRTVNSEFEIATGFTLGQHRRPKHYKRKYLRVANVQREELALDDIAELEAQDDEMIGRTLQADDLLVVEGHASPDEIGRCARVTLEAADLTFQNHLFRLRSATLVPRFALAWLNSDWVRGYWRRFCGTSSGLNTINQSMLRVLPIPVPRRQEQITISALLDSEDVGITTQQTQHEKLLKLKTGLMQDLLTGRVSVARLVKQA